MTIQNGPKCPNDRVFSDLDPVGETSNDFQQIADGGPHDTLEWNEAWLLRSVRAACKPLFVTGWDPSGRLLFLLPLTIQSRGGFRLLE